MKAYAARGDGWWGPNPPELIEERPRFRRCPVDCTVQFLSEKVYWAHWLTVHADKEAEK